ncbi:hypothetical protein K9L97_05580 [Candidatus Woesearchaeota archaeon]|nr:hypothetical protein [Candidatus Woesearchaeota archaeon]
MISLILSIMICVGALMFYQPSMSRDYSTHRTTHKKKELSPKQEYINRIDNAICSGKYDAAIKLINACTYFVPERKIETWKTWLQIRRKDHEESFKGISYLEKLLSEK